MGAFTNKDIEQKRKSYFLQAGEFSETKMSRVRSSVRRKDKERKVDYEEDYFFIGSTFDDCPGNGRCNDYSDR